MPGSRKPSTPYSRVVGFDATPLLRKTDGVARYTHSLIDAYAETFSNNKIYLLGFSDDNISDVAVLKKHTNIEFVRIPVPRKLYSVLYSRLIRLDTYRFVPRLDVFVGTNFVAFPRISRTPTLSIIHDLAYIRYPETIEKGNLRYLTKHVARSINEHAVAGVSEFTAHEIVKEFGIKQPYVIPNGINADIWKVAGSHEPKYKYILTVGTREPRKNQTALIKAYSRLPDALRREYKLVIVGKKGWGGETSTAGQEDIVYTGYVEDSELASLYRNASLFVLPSLYEGFGLPLLEAMAAGVPIAASNIEPFKEIAGGTITYFEPTSNQNIEDMLLSCLKNSHTSNYVAVLKNYTWQKSARELESAVNDIDRGVRLSK